MPVRILEYKVKPPAGVDITRNGYVDFEARRYFLEKGYPPSQLVPEDEKGKLPDRYMYDVHRRIPDYLNLKDGKNQYLNRADFKENVLEFADIYGCWFSADVAGKNYKLHNVNEWRSEWRDVQRAVKFIEFNSQLTAEFGYDVIEEKDKIKPDEIERKLNKFTNIAIESQLWRKGDTPDKFATAIRPTSIGGWVWALIAKDYYDKTTYIPCLNTKCTREIPSVSPTSGKGGLKYCSESCRSAVNYEKKKRKNNETT